MIKRSESSDKYGELVGKSKQVIAELTHGSVIKKYLDLLKAKENNGELYVYTIYLTEQPRYKLDLKHGCSIKGTEILEINVGK